MARNNRIIHKKITVLGPILKIVYAKAFSSGTFAVTQNVGRYTKTAPERRIAFASAKSIWDEATKKLLAA
ncbi:hypothetical protein [Rickettsia conorii]|uniref:hypothetical protein n=1 Tax=Rickettsia conorii TaxID=781 RepID=UPI003AF0306C